MIASACVFNNYIDRDIDKLMARTKMRALAKGSVSGRSAIIYASLLGVAGFLVLAVYTNWLTVFLGILALVVYVVIYGFTKRRSVHGTLVGSISGALPLVAGYCAVNGRFDTAAVILFFILVFWQMPHFYAIAVYRFSDYKAAKMPVLPVKKGIPAAKKQIIFYILAFIASAAGLSLFGYTGYTYLAVMLVLGLMWLKLAIKGFGAADDRVWARQLFRFSLVVLVVLSVFISFGGVLP